MIRKGAYIPPGEKRKLLKKLTLGGELDSSDAKAMGISYREQYMILFNISDAREMMPVIIPDGNEESNEKIYKKCIEQRKTWKEITRWKNWQSDLKIEI